MLYIGILVLISHSVYKKIKKLREFYEADLISQKELVDSTIQKARFLKSNSPKFAQTVLTGFEETLPSYSVFTAEYYQMNMSELDQTVKMLNFLKSKVVKSLLIK